MAAPRLHTLLFVVLSMLAIYLEHFDLLWRARRAFQVFKGKALGAVCGNVCWIFAWGGIKEYFMLRVRLCMQSGGFRIVFSSAKAEKYIFVEFKNKSKEFRE